MCDCDRELQELESCSDFCSIVRARPLKVLTKLPSWPVLPVLKPCKECGQAREVEASELRWNETPGRPPQIDEKRWCIECGKVDAGEHVRITKMWHCGNELECDICPDCLEFATEHATLDIIRVLFRRPDWTKADPDYS